MNASLVQIKEKLRLFAVSHPQVNEFSLKDPLDYLDCKESRFPAVIALFKPSTISGKNIFINMDILFMDLVHKDLSNEVDVLNDQLLTAVDLRAYLNDSAFDDLFTISESAQLTPFWEKSDNEVTGWTMGIQLIITDLKDRCQIPA